MIICLFVIVFKLLWKFIILIFVILKMILFKFCLLDLINLECVCLIFNNFLFVLYIWYLVGVKIFCKLIIIIFFKMFDLIDKEFLLRKFFFYCVMVLLILVLILFFVFFILLILIILKLIILFLYCYYDINYYIKFIIFSIF